MSIVTLLRHGQTEANAAGLLQGRLDNPLDDTGHAQAAAAARALGPVDRVITSPLRRAAQTAAHLAADTAVIDDRWIELDYGDWDGTPMKDLSPQIWARWRHDLDLRPPNGETLRELGARVRTALDALVAEDPEGHIVIVSHVSPIKAAVAWALGVGDEVSWRTTLSTGSYTQLRLGPPHPALLTFNVVPPAAEPR